MLISNILIKIASVLLTLVCIVTALITLILNPGIVYNQKNEGNNSEPKIYCFQCRFQYPHLDKVLTHCENCGVCVFGRDHHCDVFGKCVGRNNEKIFETFGFCVCLLFLFDFGSIGYILITQ